VPAWKPNANKGYASRGEHQKRRIPAPVQGETSIKTMPVCPGKVAKWPELDGGNVTRMPEWPSAPPKSSSVKLKAKEQMNADAIEQALLQEAKRAGEMSIEERAALADRMTDLAWDFMARSHRLSQTAVHVRTGKPHPLQR
jgi:hypothetical protein